MAYGLLLPVTPLASGMVTIEPPLTLTLGPEAVGLSAHRNAGNHNAAKSAKKMRMEN